MRPRTAPAAALVLLTACFNSPRYVDSPVYPKPSTDVLTAVIDILERQNYRVESITEGKQVEAVKVQLSPFNKQGKRWAATVKIDPQAEGTILHLMVEAEINTNIFTPLDESAADWGSSDFDTEEEELLMSLFGMKIMPPKIPPQGTRGRAGGR